MKKYSRNGNFANVKKIDGNYVLNIHVWAMNPIETTKETKREVIDTLKSWSLI